jgi:hypothetical protein
MLLYRCLFYAGILFPTPGFDDIREQSETDLQKHQTNKQLESLWIWKILYVELGTDENPPAMSQ